MGHKLLFLTERGQRHQQMARAAAPEQIDRFVVLRSPSQQEILAEISDADFLFSERQGPISREVIAAGKRLRLIQRLGTRTYDIDLAAARQAGVPVSALPIPYVIASAEHILWQLLALARRAQESLTIAQTADDWAAPRRTDENTFAINWSKRRGLVTLWQQTVGILGFGEIGWELAQRLQNFGCELLYHKRTRLPAPVEAGQQLAFADFQTLLARSQFLVNLLPYSRATDSLLNADAFAQMPAGGFLVSAGSGSVIDEAALAAALAQGHLAGAALDTFEWEPLPPDNPLLPLARNPAANVLLTPHTAAVSQHRGRAQDFENVRRLLRGEPPIFLVK